MSLATLFDKLRNGNDTQLGSYIFQFQSFCNPINQQLINSCKDTTGHQSFHRELSELFFCFQAVIDHLGNFIKAFSIDVAVHQVVDKCDHIARLETDKQLPCSRHIRRNYLVDIGHEHCHRELLKGRLLICISEHILRLTPERIQKVIFLKLCQIRIIFKSCIRQNGTKNFFVGRSLALTENTHQSDLNGISVKCFKFQIVESLSTLLLSEELDIVLDHRFVAFINA